MGMLRLPTMDAGRIVTGVAGTHATNSLFNSNQFNSIQFGSIQIVSTGLDPSPRDAAAI